VGSGESSGGDEDRTVSGLTIDGFTIDASGKYGISLRATGEIDIINNIIKGNGVINHGIRTEDIGSPHIIISNNTIRAFNTDFYNTDVDSAAILIRGSRTTAVIGGNLIEGTTSYWDTYAAGIRITEEAKADIVENSISGNGYGLILDSRENTVSGNLIVNNYRAIYMTQSDNIVTDNTIKENHIGVEGTGESSNIVRFNRIYDNKWMGARAETEKTTIEAAYNWWGASEIDEIIDLLDGDGYIYIHPWYVDEDMTNLCDEAAVKALNKAKNETEFYELLIEYEMALGLDIYSLSCFHTELSEFARLQVIHAMFGKEYPDADTLRYEFNIAVEEQWRLIPINTASNIEEIRQALDDNGLWLGIDIEYFDWTDYYRTQIEEYILNKRPTRGYENAEALRKVFEEIAELLAHEANAVAVVNNAVFFSEIRALLEDEDITTALGLDMSEYSVLSDLQKNYVAAILIDERPYSGYENKEDIKEVFKRTVVEVQNMSVEKIRLMFEGMDETELYLPEEQVYDGLTEVEGERETTPEKAIEDLETDEEALDDENMDEAPTVGESGKESEEDVGEDRGEKRPEK